MSLSSKVGVNVYKVHSVHVVDGVQDRDGGSFGAHNTVIVNGVKDHEAQYVSEILIIIHV